jgi:hypothetical protein
MPQDTPIVDTTAIILVPTDENIDLKEFEKIIGELNPQAICHTEAGRRVARGIFLKIDDSFKIKLPKNEPELNFRHLEGFVDHKKISCVIVAVGKNELEEYRKYILSTFKNAGEESRSRNTVQFVAYKLHLERMFQSE